MRRLRIGDKLLVCMVFSILLICIGQAITQSAPSTPILIELFTSEGCSDCPPADEFLRTLDSAQPVTGAQLIVLEEHVDYWDDLGWRDPFSSHAFTERQTDYVGRLRLATAYTPQMIVDGTYQFVGSDRRSAEKAFEMSRRVQKVPIHIASPTIQNEMLLAHVESGPVVSKAEVWLALAIEHAESQVLKGENGGHHLEHVAIVQNMTRVGKVEKGKSFSKDISVSAKSFTRPGRVIVFLQAPDQGKILGAAVERLTPETAARK
jgi:hypothetical protein